jgi:hypothetical protein
MRVSGRHPLIATAFLSLLVLACGKSADERHFTLRGQVILVAPHRREITVKQDKIKGFMTARTVPYEVSDAKVLDGVAPGDLVMATLVAISGEGRLTRITKVGKAPGEAIPEAGVGRTVCAC